MDLHNIRQDYSRQSLSKDDCAAEPLAQFKQWLAEAMTAQVHEPTAMNVATVDEALHPNARIVLLKEVNDEGFVFFSNYNSRKGRALALHPQAALTFFWPAPTPTLPCCQSTMPSTAVPKVKETLTAFTKLSSVVPKRI